MKPRAYVALMLALTALAMLAVPILAAPASQSPQAEIRAVQADEEIYDSGSRARISFEIEDNRASNDNDEEFEYRAVIEILDIKGRSVFDSHALDEDKRVILEPGDTDDVTFGWDIPVDAEPGQYSIVGSLRDWNSFSVVFDEWELRDGSGFEVMEGIKLFVTDTEHDFGELIAGQTPSKGFAVINEGNGVLEWKVTDWPEDWLSLLRPTLGETITDRGRIDVKVKRTAPFGILEGDIVIESNGGDETIHVSAFIKGNPDGKIGRVRAETSSLRTGEDALIQIRIENTGDVNVDFRVIVNIRGPSGAMVYNSNIQGKDPRVFVEEEETGDVDFVWSIPPTALPGTHTVTLELRAWNDFNLLFDETPTDSIEEEIQVRPGPRLEVSPESVSFGRFDQGETPEAEFQVTNSGPGGLTWQVAGLPDWLELVSPTDPLSGEGDIVVRVKGDAPGGPLSGNVDITSNGGDISVPVSVVIVPPPTATPTNTPIPTATPSPTPTVAPPTSTPTPVVIFPSVYSGMIFIPDGLVPPDAVLVARIGEYQSFPAAIDGQGYANLVMAPTEAGLLGLPVEFFLNGTPSAPPFRPVFFTPGAVRTINLVFDEFESPIPLPTIPPIATETPTPEPPSPTPSPAATSSPTPTTVPSATPVVPTPTPVVVVQVVTPNPTGETTDESDGDDGSLQPNSGGRCSAASSQVSALTGMANVLAFLAPAIVAAGVRTRKRKGGRAL